MKKYLALILVLVLCLSLLAGCGENAANGENAEPETPKVEDDGVMKILLIGHSMGMDSAFLFPDVARNEGMEKLVVGFLYHDGCSVAQHVAYAKENARQYAYYEYDISTQDEWLRADCSGNFYPCQAGAANDVYIKDGSIAQTLQFGIQRHDWDVVVIHSNTAESADYRDSWYKTNGKPLNLPGYIQELTDYVNENDIEKGSPIKFAWNMVWSYPTDPAARKDNANLLLQTEFDGSEYNFYKAMAKTMKEVVEPAFDFEYVFPNGTTMQNLKSTKLASAEIYRDHVNATDFGRLAAAYTWYCVLTDTAIEDCEIPAMNYKVLLDKVAVMTKTDLALSDEYRSILIEAVGNAIKNPYDITPTQFAQ